MSAVVALRLPEIVKEEAASAAVVFFCIIEDGVDAAQIVVAALLIHLLRECGTLHAPLQISDMWDVLVWDIVDDAQFREQHQRVIDLLRCHFAFRAEALLVDGHIVGKDAAVEPQHAFNHPVGGALQLVQAVEVVAPSEEKQARGVFLLLPKVDVASLCENCLLYTSPSPRDRG